MGRNAPKAAGNAFYIARCEAAKFNGTFANRDGVCEITGIDKTKLYRIEVGIVLPWPEEALLLADLYDAPELHNYYCVHCCPIGKQTMLPVQIADLDRLAIQLHAAAGKIQTAKDDLMTVAEDGVISDSERPTVEHIRETLLNTKGAIDALLLWYEKTIK